MTNDPGFAGCEETLCVDNGIDLLQCTACEGHGVRQPKNRTNRRPTTNAAQLSMSAALNPGEARCEVLTQMSKAQ